MRKFLSTLLVLCFVLGLSIMAMASGDGKTAVPTQTGFVMDGHNITFDKAYNIDGSNYIQLASVAKMLSGTSSQFNVYWDTSLRIVVIETGVPYTGVKPASLVKDVYGIGDPVTMDKTTITINNTFTSQTMPGGFSSKAGEIFYAVTFTVLTSNQPKYSQYWNARDFISYISTSKGEMVSSFYQPKASEIYPNQSTSVTVYYIIKQTDQIASVDVANAIGASEKVLVY